MHYMTVVSLEMSDEPEKTLGVWSGAFILALDTTKAPYGATSIHVLTAYGWQTIDLNDQNDCPCQFGVEFLILRTCTEVI